MHCFGRGLWGAIRLRCAPAGLVSWQCRPSLWGQPRPGHPSLPARVTPTLAGICFPWRTFFGKLSCESFGGLHGRAPRKALELAQPRASAAQHRHRIASGCWSSFPWDLVRGEGFTIFSQSSWRFSPAPPGKFLPTQRRLPRSPGGTPPGHRRRDGRSRSREEPALLGRGEDAQSQNENAKEMRERLIAFPSLLRGGRRLPDPGHSGRSQGAPPGGCKGGIRQRWGHRFALDTPFPGRRRGQPPSRTGGVGARQGESPRCRSSPGRGETSPGGIQGSPRLWVSTGTVPSPPR